MTALRLLALYPEQMNIYADRGNILFLRRRCEWRGIGFEYAAAGPGDGFDPAAHDLLYLGGGQDRDQAAVAADMVESKREAIGAAVEDGACMLAVCGGYQLLGHGYRLELRSETALQGRIASNIRRGGQVRRAPTFDQADSIASMRFVAVARSFAATPVTSALNSPSAPTWLSNGPAPSPETANATAARSASGERTPSVTATIDAPSASVSSTASSSALS